MMALEASPNANVSQSLLHQRTVSQEKASPARGDRRYVSIASSSANSFTAQTAIVGSRSAVCVSIASSSANSFTAMRLRRSSGLSMRSQSLLHQRTVSQKRKMCNQLSNLVCLNRFFISEQFHSISSAARAASRASVSIASSSANSFTGWGDLESALPLPSLNRFFISEQFHSRCNGIHRGPLGQRLNRFFISEQFHRLISPTK